MACDFLRARLIDGVWTVTRPLKTRFKGKGKEVGNGRIADLADAGKSLCHRLRVVGMRYEEQRALGEKEIEGKNM